MGRMSEFTIKIDTMPPNWNEIIDALHKEGTWANPIITPQLEIYSSGFPIPWDADVIIKDGEIRLIGAACEGGPPGNGFAETHIALSEANRHFILAFQVYNDDGCDHISRFRNILKKHGVVFCEGPDDPMIPWEEIMT